MHQDRIIHIRNKETWPQRQTPILENTHIDFAVSLPLKKWDKKPELSYLFQQINVARKYCSQSRHG